MIRALATLLIALLAGCGTPSPDFLGAERRDVVVDGMRFAVFQRGNEAQVIRLDRLPRGDAVAMADRMIRAAGQGTACPPVARSWRPIGGRNSAVARVNLRCG